MLFPGVKMTDMVIGVDFHTVFIPPSPAPIPMVPHPYFGMIFLWMTPKFPTTTVFINSMPVSTSGSQGLSVHIPMGLPAPPSMLNMMYWRRHLLNIPKGLVLAALTMFANLAISRISALFVSPNSAAGKFVADVTGVDTSSWSGTWGTVKGSYAAYTKWSTWVKLLIPPLPYPGDQGSAAIGSPNVTANGSPCAFGAPLMAASCSDLAMVPNGANVGFSNVMIGVSISDMLRALAVQAAQGAVSAGVSKAASKAASAAKDRAGKKSCGCK